MKYQLDKNVYLLSLYYKRSLVTGANKRFNEIGKILYKLFPGNCKLIVTKGNKPDWLAEKDCIYISEYNSCLSRLVTFMHLNFRLLSLPRGIVYSDFMPIPLLGLSIHKHFQLIHDLRSFTTYSRGRYSGVMAYLQKMQLRLSKKIVTVSSYSKKEIVKNCGISADKIIVSYNGVHPVERKLKPSSARTIDILYIATFEERKNHKVLIEALSYISSSLHVVLVGRDLGTLDDIKCLAQLAKCQQHMIRFIESLDERELTELLEDSKLFVSPSLFEGFGMPLLEAMNLGCNVLCSDIQVFREICEDRAVFFNPTDCKTLSSIISNELMRCIDQNREICLNKFSWKAISFQLVQELCSDQV